MLKYELTHGKAFNFDPSAHPQVLGDLIQVAPGLLCVPASAVYVKWIKKKKVTTLNI